MNRVVCLILLALASPSVFADSAACLARLQADDAAGAVTACTAAVEADPEDARSWAIRGLAHLSAGRHAEGASDLDRALGIDARLPMALIGRARLRAQADDYDGARADLQTVLGVDKAHYDALIALGELEWDDGHGEEAQALFARAAKARPDVAYPWVASAVIVVDHDRRQALKYLDKAIKASKTDARAFFLRGKLYFADTKWKDAAADFQAAVDLAPQSDEAALYWARSLEKLERPAEALAALDRSMERHPTWDVLIERMNLRLQQGDAIGAEADYTLAKKNNPSLPQDEPAAHAVDDKYAPGLRKIEAQLRDELSLPSRECALDGRARWMAALQENRGDLALAEQSLGRTLREEYIACQEKRLPPATEQFAQARQSIAAVTAAVASRADALIRDCAAHPDMTQVCAERRDAHAQRAGKLLAGLRALEEAASKRRQEVAAARNGAGEVAANAVRQAREAFTASASKEYGRYGDLGSLRFAIELVRAQPAPAISQRCTEPGVPPIRASDAIVAASNGRSGRYFDCLRDLATELGGRRSSIESAAAQLRDARTATDAVRSYRCSVGAGAGCVSDELWRSVDSLVTVAAVGQAESTAATYARLLDTDIAAASRRHNDAIARRNEQLDDYEAQVQRQRMVDTFTEAFGQATQGGYGNGGYRRDSSTSLPGVR